MEFLEYLKCAWPIYALGGLAIAYNSKLVHSAQKDAGIKVFKEIFQHPGEGLSNKEMQRRIMEYENFYR